MMGVLRLVEQLLALWQEREAEVVVVVVVVVGVEMRARLGLVNAMIMLGLVSRR